MLKLTEKRGYLCLAGWMDGKRRTLGLRLRAGAESGAVNRALAEKVHKEPELRDHLDPELIRRIHRALNQDTALAEIAADPATKMWSDGLSWYRSQTNGEINPTTEQYLDRVSKYIRIRKKLPDNTPANMRIAEMDSEFWNGFVRHFHQREKLDHRQHLVTDQYGEPEYEWSSQGQSVRRALNPIMRIMGKAESEKWIERKPKIDLPPNRSKRTKLGTEGHFRLLLEQAEADPQYHYMIPILCLHYYTGFRPVELMRLHWNRDEVEHPEKGECFINRSNPEQWTITAASKLHTESDHDDAHREIGVHPELRAALERFNHGYKGKVVRNRRGQPYVYGYDIGKNYGGAYAKPFNSLKKRAGIDNGITPYSLRHGFATRLIKKGVSLATVKRAMGHASIETTQRYINISPEDTIGLVHVL